MESEYHFWTLVAMLASGFVWEDES